MAVSATQLAATPNRRLASLIAPREHGAWGVLLVPLVTGSAVGLLAGGSGWPLLAFTVSAVALFCLRTPLESWMGTGLVRAQTPHERGTVALTALILAAVAVFSLASLLRGGRNRQLLLLGVIAVSSFVVQSIFSKLGRRTRMLAQVVGTLGLTVTAPAAYYLVTGQLDGKAGALWMANFLFAGNQVHFVHLRIHSARLIGWPQKVERGRSFLVGELLLATSLVLAWRFDLLPGLAVLAFLPLLFRGTAWFFEREKSLAVRRLGWTEMAHAVVFGICLIAGFRLGR